MDEENASLLVQRTRSSRKWLWVVPAAVLACVGVVGVGMRPRVTMVQHYRGFHSKAMKIALRLLQADELQELNFDYSSKCDGAADPDAMSFEATLQHDETIADDVRPAYEVTFKAKDGKQDDLLRLFKNVVDGAIKFEQDENGEDIGDEVNKLVDIRKDGTSGVVVSVSAPEDEEVEKMTADTLAAIKVADPKLSVTVKYGRTVDQMLKHKDENVLVVSEGTSVSITTSIASVFLESIVADMPDAMKTSKVMTGLNAMMAIKSVDTALHDVYNRDKVAEIDAPTLAEELGNIGGMMRSSIPAAIRDPLVGLDALSAGFSSVSLVGLPGKFKMDLKMNNVRVAPLFKEFLAQLAE